MKEAFEIIKTIVSGFSSLRLFALGLEKPDLVVGLLSVVLLMVVELIKELRIEVISVLREAYVTKVLVFLFNGVYFDFVWSLW